MNHCSSGCKTPGAHNSYGECLRAKSVSVTGLESTGPGITRERERKWNAELNAYSAAVKEGVQPEGTSMAKIDAAKKAADTAA